MKRALIIGHDGQDGSYLYETLVERGYGVVGVSRSTARTNEAASISPVDVMDRAAVQTQFAARPFHEVYYLAAFHHSSEMDTPEPHDLLLNSLQIHAIGLLNVLDAVRIYAPAARVFYAASSHLFGDPAVVPQDETTPYRPTCAYGISKLAGLNLMHFYRDNYNLFCACGILYNHESPRRSPRFLSRKIAAAAVAIRRGQLSELQVGDLKAKVDWGFAPDYVDAMWRILQLPEPDDFVIATGELNSVQDFIEEGFSIVGLNWKDYVSEDPSIIKKRPRKAPLQGNYSKLAKMTGWRPKADLRKIADEIIQSEVKND